MNIAQYPITQYQYRSNPTHLQYKIVQQTFLWQLNQVQTLVFFRLCDVSGNVWILYSAYQLHINAHHRI